MTRPGDNELFYSPLVRRPIKSSSLCGNGKIFNRILLTLPPEVRGQLMCACHRVELPFGQVIYRAGVALEDAYFVEHGLVCLLKSMTDGRCAEIGMVGDEGLVGAGATFEGGNAIADYVVQVPAVAYCINRSQLRRMVSNHEALRSLLAGYLSLLREQLAQTSACNRLHSLEQRCCHRLLIAHDSASADEFELTHEFLASLLGVQRPSLSMTANRLQKRGLIRCSYGHIAILDRASLEAAACECYRTRRWQIDRFFAAEKSYTELHERLDPNAANRYAFHENYAVKPSGT